MAVRVHTYYQTTARQKQLLSLHLEALESAKALYKGIVFALEEAVVKACPKIFVRVATIVSEVGLIQPALLKSQLVNIHVVHDVKETASSDRTRPQATRVGKTTQLPPKQTLVPNEDKAPALNVDLACKQSSSTVQ